MASASKSTGIHCMLICCRNVVVSPRCCKNKGKQTMGENCNEWPNSSMSTHVQWHCQVLSWTGAPIESIISQNDIILFRMRRFEKKASSVIPDMWKWAECLRKVQSINQHLLQITSCFFESICIFFFFLLGNNLYHINQSKHIYEK